MVKWLVEVLHYPFDMTFKIPPPVDIDAIADYWKKWEGWDDVSTEDARALVREEALWDKDEEIKQ